MNRVLLFILLASTLILFSCLHYYFTIFHGVGYVYPLDDAYIHLAIAKNFVAHFVWGVTPHDFSSSSSSPLYVLILSAMMFLFGNHQIIPFIVNIILAVSLLYVVFFYANQHGGYKIAILSSAIIYISIPISANIYNGMEHLLHTLLTLMFLFLYTNNKKYQYPEKSLFLVAVLLVATRYESLFLISVVTLVEMFDRRFRFSALLILYSCIPVVIYGLISVLSGDMFLPYSILLKGDIPTNTDRLMKIPFAVYYKLTSAPHLAGLFFLNLLFGIYTILKFGGKTLNFKLISTAVTATILHLIFANVGWVYRYEAYLIILNLFATFSFLTKNLTTSATTRHVFVILFIIAMVPSFTRYIESLNHIPTMSKNIHDQQILMSKFLKEHYDNSPVVLNDIGVCCYFTNIQLTDLVGIADRDIVKLRLNKQFTANEIDKLTKNRMSEIAIIYSQGFEGYIPNEWTKVATMSIQNNIGCAYDTVTFFSISQDTLQIKHLRQNLINFMAKIPDDVSLRIQ